MRAVVADARVTDVRGGRGRICGQRVAPGGFKPATTAMTRAAASRDNPTKGAHTRTLQYLCKKARGAAFWTRCDGSKRDRGGIRLLARLKKATKLRARENCSLGGAGESTAGRPSKSGEEEDERKRGDGEEGKQKARAVYTRRFVRLTFALVFECRSSSHTSYRHSSFHHWHAYKLYLVLPGIYTVVLPVH